MTWETSAARRARHRIEVQVSGRITVRLPELAARTVVRIYGLLTVTIPRAPEPGRCVRADMLTPEPLDTWYSEIRALRAVAELWDTGKHRAVVADRITERLARAPFHLTAKPDGAGRIALRYRPVVLIDAIWQQFAREVAGIVHCARCPAPNCGRWFLQSQTRSDRQYCSSACRMRAWRASRHGNGTDTQTSFNLRSFP